MGNLCKNNPNPHARWRSFPEQVQRRRASLKNHNVAAATITGWDKDADELFTTHGVFTGVFSGGHIRLREDSENNT